MKILLFLVILHLISGQKILNDKRPRQRLETKEQVLDFIRNARDGPLLLAFIPQDKEGAIAQRDNEQGPYRRFIQIDNKNHHVAMGLIVCNELPKMFGVHVGMHFVQVDAEDGRYRMKSAGFFKDNTLAEYNHGEVIAMVDGDVVNPVTDANPDAETAIE